MANLAVFLSVRFNRLPSDWYPESSDERRLKLFDVDSDEGGEMRIEGTLCAGARFSRYAVLRSGVVVGRTTPALSFLTDRRRRGVLGDRIYGK